MRVLSSAFCRLKTKLPWVPADTKLSKLDTLRLATIYIQQLRTSLATGKDLYYSTNDISRFDTNTSNGQNQTSLVSIQITLNYKNFFYDNSGSEMLHLKFVCCNHVKDLQ